MALLHRSFSSTLIYLFNPENELYSVHRRNIGASVIEINEGMSKLLDKQVDTENENQIKILGFTQALVK